MWVSPDHIFILEKELRDFPSGPGVRTSGFYHRGWWGELGGSFGVSHVSTHRYL